MYVDQDRLKKDLDDNCRLIIQLLKGINVYPTEINPMIAAYRDAILKRHGLAEKND